MGVRFHGQRALPLLEQSGATVDPGHPDCQDSPGAGVAGHPTTPKSVVLGARNPIHDYALPADESHYCIDGTASFVLDFESGEKRYGTRRDIEQSLRVFQQMDMGVMAWAPTVASDAPAHSRALHEFVGIMKSPPSTASTRCITRGRSHTWSTFSRRWQAVRPNSGAGRNYSLIYCPVAPLVHDGDMLDAYLELGAWDLPVMIMPMPVNGTTGPASLFSNLALANAEALSSIVVYQLAHPGRPLIYSSATGSVDFRTGAYLAGTPEMGIQSAALVTMGRYYGLPSTSAGCSSDAKEPGAEAVLDKLMTTVAPVCAGSDIIVGTGVIEGDQLLILEQLVVDNEIGHLCRRLKDGVDGAESRDLFDDIAQVGPGGHFLKSRNTRLAARSREFYMSDLLDRHPYDAWVGWENPACTPTPAQRSRRSSPLRSRIPFQRVSLRAWTISCGRQTWHCLRRPKTDIRQLERHHYSDKSGIFPLARTQIVGVIASCMP